MKKHIILAILTIVLFSCKQQAIDDNIYWVESNAICVHWTDFAKNNFDTRLINAIRIVLKSSNSNAFESKTFYLNTVVVEETSFLLDKTQRIEKINTDYYVSLVLRSEALYDLFPKGESYYGDDCYLIELANMIGQGRVTTISHGKNVEIQKARDYSFSIGPK